MSRAQQDAARALAASQAQQAQAKQENEQHSLRDYFAAQAIGILAWTDSTVNECARTAYVISDAMLKARKGDNDA